MTRSICISASPIAAALALAAIAAGAGASAALAAPSEVQVRIEGKSEALFEGPLLTEGHDIQASSETEAHPCDGINPNEPQNTAPGPTATASAVDAMSLIGETFDGRWYSSYDDFLITRWGPQREAEGETWSLFINNTLLNIGGCQYELHPGAEVLWDYATPTSKPLLALFPQGTASAAPPLTAVAKLGVPFSVEALAYKAKASSDPPPLPERAGATPYAGAHVVPVQTAANGFERPLAESPQGVQTNAEGRASIMFTASGWHRIMAVSAGAVRSNRLDVCVPVEGAQGCGAPPAEDVPRPNSGQSSETPTSAPGGGNTSTSTSTSTSAGHNGKSSSPLGVTGGTSTSTAPAAAGHALRIDGLALTPLSVLSRSLHYHGNWRRHSHPGAWQGIVMAGAKGATLSVELPPGRPVFMLTGTRAPAVVELRSAGRRATYMLHASSNDDTRLLLGRRRTDRGRVTLRVIAGTVDVDGVAVTP